MSKEAVPWLLLGLAYLVIRTLNLTGLPLFIDEGLYIFGGESILQGDLTRGWGEGRPLNSWLDALFTLLGVGPILAVRLPYVLLGALCLASTAWIAGRYFSRRVALISAVLYVLLPFPLFFERLATPDVGMAATGMISLGLSCLTVERGRWHALLAGIMIVVTMLWKMPVSIYFVVCPVLAVLLLRNKARSWREDIGRLVIAYALPAAFLLLTAGIVVYRWRAGFTNLGFGLSVLSWWLGLESSTLVPPPDRLANIRTLFEWWKLYLTWPIAVLAVAAPAVALVRRNRVALLFSLVAYLFLAVFIVTALAWVPRYVLPVVPMLIVLVAWQIVEAVDSISRWLAAHRPFVASHRGTIEATLLSLILLGEAIIALPFCATLLSDPRNLQLPAADRGQYIEGGAAGYGLELTAQYLTQLSQVSGEEWQVVAFHISDYARLRAYLPHDLRQDVWQVHIVNRQPLPTSRGLELVRQRIIEDSSRPNFAVIVDSGGANEEQLLAAFPLIQLVQDFPKPGGQSSVRLYLLLPVDETM